jgi:hypothetical protein
MTSNLPRIVLRRSRGSFDGNDPVFVLAEGRKIALAQEQIQTLEYEANKLAELHPTEIEKLVDGVLSADHTGRDLPFDGAAFFNGLTRFSGLTEEVQIDPPTDCDQCGRNLHEIGFFLDACTVQNMMWSWMCPPCFLKIGCGVGEGWGQLYGIKEGKMLHYLG